MNMKNLSSKVALVTGASSGIGQATAELLGKAGYTVYGTSRRGGIASGQSFEMLPLDVTRDESVADTVNQLMQRESRIDLLVNSAGFGVRLTLLRRFAPAGLMDAGIRRDLRLDATLAVEPS